MIISAPGKVLKGTVNTVHSIATKSIRGAGGLVNTTGVRETGRRLFLSFFFLGVSPLSFVAVVVATAFDSCLRGYRLNLGFGDGAIDQ